MYYYRARYYDAGLGRFISEDPIGFGGSDFNLYRYVGNSPISFVDPLGLKRYLIESTMFIRNLLKGANAFSDLLTTGQVGVGSHDVTGMMINRYALGLEHDDIMAELKEINSRLDADCPGSDADIERALYLSRRAKVISTQKRVLGSQIKDTIRTNFIDAAFSIFDPIGLVAPILSRIFN